MPAHGQDLILESRVVEEVLSLIRVSGKVVQFVWPVGITEHQFPFFVPDHPHRAILVEDHHRTVHGKLRADKPLLEAVAGQSLGGGKRGAGELADGG